MDNCENCNIEVLPDGPEEYEEGMGWVCQDCKDTAEWERNHGE